MLISRIYLLIVLFQIWPHTVWQATEVQCHVQPAECLPSGGGEAGYHPTSWPRRYAWGSRIADLSFHSWLSKYCYREPSLYIFCICIYLVFVYIFFFVYIWCLYIFGRRLMAQLIAVTVFYVKLCASQKLNIQIIYIRHSFDRATYWKKLANKFQLFLPI